MKKTLFCLILLPSITAAQQVEINGGEVKVQAGDTYVDVNGAGRQGDIVVRNTATDGGTAAVKGIAPTSSAQVGGEVRVETKTVSTRTDSRGSSTHSTVSTQSTTGGGGSYVNGDLDGSHFAGKQLAGTAFTNASLIDADFRNADLQNADFTNADLTRARLQGADLRHATITNTDFSDATLDGAQWVDGRTCGPGSIGSCR